MDERATGLILRTRLLTESSLIVEWLTPDLGRLATVAKGARRARSPFRGKLDVFYLAEFSFVRSRRSSLHTLREVSVRETHRALRQDVGLLQQAAYCAALLEQSTETETPLPELFALLTGLLKRLGERAPQPHTILAFELKLLFELGQSPDLARVPLGAGDKQVLAKLLEADWPILFRLRPSPSQINNIARFLHGFLIYHLGKLPTNRGAALQGATPF